MATITPTSGSGNYTANLRIMNNTGTKVKIVTITAKSTTSEIEKTHIITQAGSDIIESFYKGTVYDFDGNLLYKETSAGSMAQQVFPRTKGMQIVVPVYSNSRKSASFSQNNGSSTAIKGQIDESEVPDDSYIASDLITDALPSLPVKNFENHDISASYVMYRISLPIKTTMTIGKNFVFTIGTKQYVITFDIATLNISGVSNVESIGGPTTITIESNTDTILSVTKE